MTGTDDTLDGLGLRRVRCDATPPHRTWVIDDGGYGPPCPWCRLDQYEQADQARCRHRAWRRWALTRRAVLALHRVGLLTGPGVWKVGYGCDRCLVGIRFPGEGHDHG